MFIDSLSGDMQKTPTIEDVEPYLNKMTDDIMLGKNIMHYVVFDRQ
ncbi:MAG: hypothetical protein ACI9UT_000909 [Flavobacteriales bacterium]|jgi:hypothetical protein